MASDDARDPVVEMLTGLPATEPSRASIERTRARCHEAIARRRAQQMIEPRDSRPTRVFDVAVFAVLFVYMGAVIDQAVRLNIFR